MLVGITLLLLLAVDARAEVFHSRESALRLAFPDCDAVDARTLVLDDVQAAEATKRAGAKLPSKVVRAYVGQCDGHDCGYAFIETHRVRSLPETVMVVVTPEGRIDAAHLLAFHEPKEYLPSSRWLTQFDGEELDADLGLGRDVAGIAGSTLTAQAITACVRRAAALAAVCLIEPTATAALDATTSAGTR